jgi:hypothetical protein
VLYYVACWIASQGLQRCGHQHESIAQAMACMTTEGSFLRAVDRGTERSLDEDEMRTFLIELGKGHLKIKGPGGKPEK